jgi:hypothetical protein
MLVGQPPRTEGQAAIPKPLTMPAGTHKGLEQEHVTGTLLASSETNVKNTLITTLITTTTTTTTYYIGKDAGQGRFPLMDARVS